MRAILLAVALLCLILNISSSSHALSSSDNVILNSVDRTFDLSSHLAKLTLDIEVEAIGSSVSSFLVALEPHLSPAFVSATTEKGEELLVSKEKSAQSGALQYRVTLKQSISSGSTIDIVFKAVIPNAQEPFPKQVAQGGNQLVKFKAFHHIPSPYTIKKQTSTLTLPNSSIESYSKLKPVAASGSSIKYGPYSNASPFSDAAGNNELAVHFESNTPFLTALDVNHNVEVSHWGNIAVEDEIYIRNTGAELKGSFSRFHFQRSQPLDHIIREFTTTLPPKAADVYYRDVIGNISTSHVRESDAGISVEIAPRFALFGGWQTKYILGYNLPTAPYLSVSGSKYKLDLPIVDSLFKNLYIVDLEVHVILPEGASNIKLTTSLDIEESRTTHSTYLDTVGRPVLVLKLNNIVDNHLKNISIEYDFSTITLIREPLMLVVFFFVLFFVFIIVNRLDLSIKSSGKSKEE